jgi:membrane-bound serine protease (ClpP class)
MTALIALPAWLRNFGRLTLIALAAAMLQPAQAQPTQSRPAQRVFLSDVSGIIGIATIRQITRAIERTAAEHGAALILRLDTPGGLVSSTREIIKAMIAAPVPVIVYVAPSGARAASAGTYIVYASHIAAMAPGTNIGAATPIELGGMPGLPKQEPKKDKDENNRTIEQRKVISDMVAMIKSLAQLRGRNAEWAEKAVREAATLTATEAQNEKVIDFVASNVDDLLAQTDGRAVTVNGATQTLVTKGATVVTIEPDWRTRALAAISDPNIAFMLLLIGFYGIILEFWTPGTFVPGTIGAISLIVGLTALSTLPVHYGALGLLILGIALMIGEMFTPGVGILGVGGLTAFIVGSIYLFEGGNGGVEFAVSLPLILGAAAVTAVLIFAIVGAAMKSRARPPASGSEQLIGGRAEVLDWNGSSGSVRVQGEIWNARGHKALQPHDAVRIVGRDGLTLIVES